MPFRSIAPTSRSFASYNSTRLIARPSAALRGTRHVHSVCAVGTPQLPFRYARVPRRRDTHLGPHATQRRRSRPHANSEVKRLSIARPYERGASPLHLHQSTGRSAGRRHDLDRVRAGTPYVTHFPSGENCPTTASRRSESDAWRRSLTRLRVDRAPSSRTALRSVARHAIRHEGQTIAAGKPDPDLSLYPADRSLVGFVWPSEGMIQIPSWPPHGVLHAVKLQTVPMVASGHPETRRTHGTPRYRAR